MQAIIDEAKKQSVELQRPFLARIDSKLDHKDAGMKAFVYACPSGYVCHVILKRDDGNFILHLDYYEPLKQEIMSDVICLSSPSEIEAAFQAVMEICIKAGDMHDRKAGIIHHGVQDLGVDVSIGSV